MAEGFVVTYPIHNNWNDLQGFVGYLPSDNSIWVAFRGTESWDNYWKIDFDDIFMKYDDFPECNCYVHTGFQTGAKTVEIVVVNEVKRL